MSFGVCHIYCIFAIFAEQENCDIMKKIAILTIATTALVISGCGQPKNAAPAEEGSKIDYSISFFRNVVSAAEENENIFVSPYSAGVALSMLAEGAHGQTEQELLSVLNGVDFGRGDIVADSLVDVRSANAVWIRDGFKVKSSYIETLSDKYGAMARNLDFSSQESVDIINSWCSENTEGKITGIIDHINSDMVMFLMNALYFKAPWEKQFNKDMTAEDTFHGYSADGKVPFMYAKGKYSYAEYSGNQLIMLPYAGGRYSMLVLLPAEDVSPDAVLPYLNEASYKEALDAMSQKEVILRLPKFKMETTTLLNQTLAAMGAKKVFTRDAELGGISDGRIAVDEVKQKCFVEVNEEGSEAAAVTSIGIRLTSANVGPLPVVMTVDRPFMFAIVDTENDNILFIGRVMNL